MRFSFNWLKKHLNTNLNLEEIANKLTSIGLEVESVINPEKIFKNFKLVQIINTEKHPDSDHLKLCMVSDAEGNQARIVCGAKNARTDLKTVLAMQGAIIPATNAVLKKSKIRGIESEGMMCSAEELAIADKDSVDGIIELPEDIDLATSVGDALGFDGGIIDVSITPNRGDCFSVRGIARDLAAAGAGNLITPEWLIEKKEEADSKFLFPIDIDYEKNEVSRQYAPMIAFQVVRGLKNGHNSAKIKMLLKCAGLNSISAIVDLANLWMIDNGRPLHIYDLKKIEGNLRIRFAHSGEKFTDLNGIEHDLKHDMLISADDGGPVCLLGVMGGAKVACDENTTDVLIESAFFDPVFISRAGTFLNLTSDSRTRFERGIDPESCVRGLTTFGETLIKNCGGTKSELFIVGEQPKNLYEVCLKKSKLWSICGFEVDWEKAKNILKKLGLVELFSSEDEITFRVPSWRSDIRIEEDLIEEVLRIIGYDNIRENPIEMSSNGRDRALEEKNTIISMKKLLASLGLSEIVSYSFQKQEYADLFSNGKKVIHLLNPISEDLGVMRPSLLPNLLVSAQKSLNYGSSHVELFEAGNVFSDNCSQELNISGIRIGTVGERTWLGKDRNADVFDAKKDLFALLNYCGIEEKDISIEHHAPSYYHPSRCGTVMQGKKIIGYFGELHPKINKLFDISEKIMGFEFLLESVTKKKKNIVYIDKVFPKISRDFAFVFNADTSIGNAVGKISKLDEKITDVKVFDCFDMGNNKKSVGIAVEMCNTTKTMTEEEAQEISAKIIQYVENVGGVLRSK